MQNQKVFLISSKFVCHDISSQLLKIYHKNLPIVMCLGSDKVLSDMVGVLVADILKQRHIPTYIFGGKGANINKKMAQVISRQISPNNLLFVDSGFLSQPNTIQMSPKTLLNNGRVIYSWSIVCGTIKAQNGKILLAETRFDEVLKYAHIVADAICDYFCYVNLISGKNTIINDIVTS